MYNTIRPILGLSVVLYSFLLLVLYSEQAFAADSSEQKERNKSEESRSLYSEEKDEMRDRHEREGKELQERHASERKEIFAQMSLVSRSSGLTLASASSGLPVSRSS